jgi:hypothetical protein
MTIFDYMNDILFTKEENLKNDDDEAEYNQYMMNRWVSMYSPQIANLVNNTANWLYPILSEKKDHYKFMHSIMPKLKRKHIPYIKKVKTEKKEEDNVELIAKGVELSQREVKYLLNEQSRY